LYREKAGNPALLFPGFVREKEWQWKKWFLV
jgi:hypothetical protein